VLRGPDSGKHRAAAAALLALTVLCHLIPAIFALVAAGVAASYALLRADRQIWAGVALGALALKPQLALLVPVALLVARKDRACAGSVRSLGALAVSGFADMLSVNIRSTTVALATPDELRGRVNAVEMVFISASNQLGAFESGAAAALVGTIPAVVAGGAATIVIAALWLKLFPELSLLDMMENLRPEETPGTLPV